MEDLITTVRERYGRMVSYRGLSTLYYREKAMTKTVSSDFDESRRRGILGFLRPQLQSVSKKIHDEVGRILERRDKLLLQNVTREIPPIIGRNTAQLRSDSLRFEKMQTDRTIRLEKRVDLITADTGAKLKAVQREMERLKAGERSRAREEVRTERERLLTAKNLRQRESREAEREREQFRREISADITRTERRIARKLRDDEEYEKRRRG